MTTCTSCRADNADTAKFCSSCGAELTRRCPACGAAASGRFCSECGTNLEAPSPAVPSGPATDGRPPLAERRITSVLFGDLVGFTSLSETRDPDDVRELLSHYFTVARTIVERYGGLVEKFIGDAVMAVWGVPSAHEDDAERAVRAGLDLVDAVVSLGEEIGAGNLTMRVGVVTGEVAVNVGARGEGMVAGDAVNTASRVQTAAAPGTVYVDDQTRQLTAAAVTYDDQGEHQLKGKSEPMRLFAARQVVAAVGGARRVDGLEAAFVGRDRELRLVKELFHATLEESRPRLVAVFGPAGVGKTRLGWEFDKYVDGIQDAVHWHRGRCLSYGEGASFWGLAEMVRGRLGILEGDNQDVVSDRLRAGLEEHVPDPDERSWLFPRVAALIGVTDGTTTGAAFSRDDLFSAWRTFFERVAVSSGSVGAYLQIDDLQWADEALLAFLDHVVNTAQTPIFVLALARTELTERAPAFGTGRRATALHLEPLADAAMTVLVDGLVDDLPESLRAALVARAEGIPLFAVETVRALIDRDAVIPREGRYVLAADAAERVDLDDVSLPTSLHTLIASRLDALPAAERRVVQDAAVLGQSFTRNGLEALRAPDDDVDVDSALSALVRKEIFAIDSDPRSPERGQYQFVQALVKTVAYDMLSRRDRKARHLAAAAHLAFEADADTVPAVLASHYLGAHAAAGQDTDAEELAARAVELLELAAERARALGAPGEARRHLDAALALVTEPAAVARLTEATSRVTLAAGAASDAVALAETARQVYVDAGLELDAARALALWGEALIAAGAGRPAIEPLSECYEKLAEQPGAEAVAAQLALGVARAYYLSMGDSREAIPWFDRAVVLGEALEDIRLLATTLASYAGALVLEGRSRMGLGLLRVSLDLARGLGDPSIQIRPLNNLVSFLATRDLTEAANYADEGVAITRRLGDREWGTSMYGSAAHVYWNSGEWDTVVALADEIGEMAEHSPALVIMLGYVAAIRAARGLPVESRHLDSHPTGMRVDVMFGTAENLLAAATARAAGDLAEAARLSDTAAMTFSDIAGVDDDFPIFWLTAVDDQLAVGDVDKAARLLALVTDSLRGHVPPLLRALQPYVAARVAMRDDDAGDDSETESRLAAAAAALREFGAPFYLARTLLEHAELLARRGRDADAAPLVAEASIIFSRLKSTPWVERAERLRPASAMTTEVAAAP